MQGANLIYHPRVVEPADEEPWIWRTDSGTYASGELWYPQRVLEPVPQGYPRMTVLCAPSLQKKQKHYKHVNAIMVGDDH